MGWQYQRTERQFDGVPAGAHRVVIDSVEKAVSKSGNDMLVMKMKVSGCTAMLWHYIVFMDNHPEITNQKLTEVFDSFGIEDGDFNLANWEGRAGGAMVKIDENGYPKVSYFIRKDKQDKLPPWKGEAPQKHGVATPVESPDDCPW